MVIRLGDKTAEEGMTRAEEGVEQNEENGDLTMPQSDMTTRTQNDFFVHTRLVTWAKRSAHECSVTRTREKCCVLCASGGDVLFTLSVAS